jgi:hypothetical protein
MAFGYQGNFYGGGADVESMYNRQANQTLGVGNVAASMADPFATERKGYQNQLRSLMANPGEFASSPAYQFSYNQGLNALQRKGGVRSGNKLAALMNYGQEKASQLYFPQAQLLSNLAMSGSSPGTAGAAYQKSFERSQDQTAMGKYSGMSGQNQGGGARAGSGGGYSGEWWNDPSRYATQDADRARLYGGSGSGNMNYYSQGYMPSGGYGGNSGGGYDQYGLSGYSNYGNYTPEGAYYDDGDYSDYDYS